MKVLSVASILMRRSLPLLAALVFIHAVSLPSVSASSRPAAADPKLLLSQGKVNEALAAYDALIAEDPKNYMNYYMRATTYLSMGKMASALADLDRVIAIRPDFDQAYLHRGKVYLRDGLYERALSDLEASAKSVPKTAEVEQLLVETRKLNRMWAEVQKLSVKSNANVCNTIIPKLAEIIEASPTFPQARIIRGQCYLHLNQLDSAILDYTRAANFMGDSSEQNYLLAKLYLVKGDREKAAQQVAECLRMSPESGTCLKLFKKLKTLNKALESMQSEVVAHPANAQATLTVYMNAVTAANAEFSDELSQNLFGLYEEASWKGLCSVYVKASNGAEAVKWCGKALAKDETSFDLLELMAEACILAEDFEAAVRHYEKGARMDQSNRKFADGLEKAKMLLKRSKQRDYYKVLGVPRTATEQEIKRAYRKLAVQWHPDKHSEATAHEAAQKKMIEINQAYDVLKDPKSRAQFDQGIDPNDPQAAAGFRGPGGQFFNQDQIFQLFQQQFGGGAGPFGGRGGGGFHHQQQQQRGGRPGGAGGHGGHGAGGHYYGGQKFEFDL